MTAPSYPYPVPNSQIIQTFGLEKHFEGGFFSQRASLDSYDSSTDTSEALKGRKLVSWGPGLDATTGDKDEPEAGQHGEGKRVEANSIYYLLTPDSYRGKMHMNLHAHFHCLHAGRARYTLIKPPSSPNSPPEVRRVVLGLDVAKGEVPQLFVPGGWWKASEMPEDDVQRASDAKDKEHFGCLITEVVVPGWMPDQHIFIDEDKLKEMWGGKAGWEEFKPYLSSAP